jgi:hypothetical protein
MKDKRGKGSAGEGDKGKKTKTGQKTQYYVGLVKDNRTLGRMILS